MLHVFKAHPRLSIGLAISAVAFAAGISLAIKLGLAPTAFKKAAEPALVDAQALHGYTPDPSKALKFSDTQEMLSSLLLDGVQSANGVLLNMSGPAMVVYTDIHCMECAPFYASIYAYRQRFAVKFVPASLGNIPAHDSATVLLAAKDSRSLLELQINSALRGKIAISETDDQTLHNAGSPLVMKNDDILNKHGISRLPYTVFSVAPGKYSAIEGVVSPQDLLAILGDPMKNFKTYDPKFPTN